ncbi:uncharacterized protein LOC111690680 isoform X2 [Lucilia cuprina]|uniref:uncharacterized protein LOC111690680 isoform X2 n=1 Tax=Lucilia cuprina TaxID=7375 RepID=UPI001F06FDBF|nr:uncharacterized protein LOC111690680 isoform X2 [Lucilia cuprina]
MNLNLNHTDLGRGFSKKDKTSQEKLWTALKDELNAAGPPTKDLGDWKKTWLDWKSNVKRKLSHNKKEVRQTGGGNFNQYILSQLEEEVAIISGIYETVDGIKNTQSFGKRIALKSNNDDICISSSESDTSSSQSQGPSTSVPKKRKRTNPYKSPTQNKRKSNGNLEELMKNESYQLESIGQKIKQLSEIKSEERSVLENKLDIIGNKLDNICTNLEKIGKKYDALIEVETKKLQEANRHNICMEKM